MYYKINQRLSKNVGVIVVKRWRSIFFLKFLNPLTPKNKHNILNLFFRKCWNNFCQRTTSIFFLKFLYPPTPNNKHYILNFLIFENNIFIVLKRKSGNFKNRFKLRDRIMYSSNSSSLDSFDWYCKWCMKRRSKCVRVLFAIVFFYVTDNFETLCK